MESDTDGDRICDLFESDKDGDGFTVAQGDCDDTDPNMNPGVEEIL